MHNQCNTTTSRFRQQLTKPAHRLFHRDRPLDDETVLLALSVAALLLGTTEPARPTAQSTRIRTSRQSRTVGNERSALAALDGLCTLMNDLQQVLNPTIQHRHDLGCKIQ